MKVVDLDKLIDEAQASMDEASDAETLQAVLYRSQQALFLLLGGVVTELVAIRETLNRLENKKS